MDEKEKLLKRIERLQRKGRAIFAHADAMEREFHVLKKAGYFDAEGRPRTGPEGKKIWDEVQRELKQERANLDKLEEKLQSPFWTKLSELAEKTARKAQ